MILIDSNIFIAFINAKDKNHQRAKELVSDLLAGQYGSRYTISEVFSEVSTFLYSKTKQKEVVQKAWDLIYSTKNSLGQVFIVNRENIEQAWIVFQTYASTQKPLSFVDCLIIALAQRNQIDKIASFDSEFDGILERIH